MLGIVGERTGSFRTRRRSSSSTSCSARAALRDRRQPPRRPTRVGARDAARARPGRRRRRPAVCAVDEQPEDGFTLPPLNPTMWSFGQAVAVIAVRPRYWCRWDPWWMEIEGRWTSCCGPVLSRHGNGSPESCSLTAVVGGAMLSLFPVARTTLSVRPGLTAASCSRGYCAPTKPAWPRMVGELLLRQPEHRSDVSSMPTDAGSRLPPTAH